MFSGNVNWNLKIEVRSLHRVDYSGDNNQVCHEMRPISFSYSLIASDVTAAMLVEKVFWKFDSIILQKFELHLSIVLGSTWPSYRVSAIRELSQYFQEPTARVFREKRPGGIIVFLARSMILRLFTIYKKFPEISVEISIG